MTLSSGNVRPGFANYLSLSTSSFSDLLAACHPDRLAGAQSAAGSQPSVSHGTTIVALTFAEGVVIAGDRQVTSGYSVAYRYAQKVHPTDDSSCMGVAGTGALAFELIRLFAMELQHYEKLEGVELSLLGKANKLSSMVRGNMSLAMQGLSMVPLFVGYDHELGAGRIFSYDPIGAMSEEYQGYWSIGSGSTFALGSLKKMHDRGMTERQAVTAALEALYDAAENDVATMGPDVSRRIFPLVRVVTSNGERGLDVDEVEAVYTRILAGRQERPDGPWAQVAGA